MQDLFKTYPGDPWHADEDDDAVKLFKGNLQIAKMPKHAEEYECYWPTPEQLEWLLQVLNQSEKVSPSP